MKVQHSFISKCLLGLFLTIPLHAYSEDQANRVIVAVAANFHQCMEDLIAAYHNENAQAVIQSSVGSSGALLQQILHGAPFDIFFSADLEHAQALKNELNIPHKVTIYAYGEIAAYSSNAQLFNNSKNPTENFPSMRIKRFALADPDIAPYGKAVKALPSILSNLSAAQEIRANNVAHAFQYAAHRVVDCAFVSLAQITQYRRKHNNKGSFFRFTEAKPIPQAALLLNEQSIQAHKFLSFILANNKAHNIITSHGYTLVNDETQQPD